MPPPRIKVRGGARSKGIPSGHILGRVSPGNGDIELLDTVGQRQAGIASAGQVAGVAATHGFGFFTGGLPNDNELLGSAVYAFNMTFASGDPNSTVVSGFPAAATAVMNVKAPDPHTGLDVVVGTFTFAAASKTAVIAWSGGSYTLLAGKALKLYAPTPRDASLADIRGNIEGTSS